MSKPSVSCGVLQGSVLFLNGFPEILTNCDVIQFADDTAIFASAKDVDCREFKLSEETFVENKLGINSKAGKTEIFYLTV